MKFGKILAMKIVRLILCATLCASFPAQADRIVRTAAGLREVLSKGNARQTPFELRATALSSPPGPKSKFAVSDESGGVFMYDFRKKRFPLSPGDIIAVSGIAYRAKPHDSNDRHLNANCTNIVTLSHGSPPEPAVITPDDISRKDLLYKSVVANGILIDVRRDEIDPHYIMFVLDCSGSTLYASTYTTYLKGPVESLQKLIGATVAIKGILTRTTGSRIHSCEHIFAHGENPIHVIKAPPDEVFKVAEIGDTKGFSPEQIVTLGRRRASGKVLAVWKGDTLLMRSRSGKAIKVAFVGNQPAPGSDIEAVGYAGTDLFNVNLSNAIWRPSGNINLPPEQITDLTIKELIADGSGERRIQAEYHGETVRLAGTVQSILSGNRSSQRIVLASDGYTIPVDFGSADNAFEAIKTGCRITVTGTFIAETENWSRMSPIPRILEVFISVRDASDVKIISMPPWWTSGRMAAVIGALALMLVAILVWNASLHTLSERRGRELFRSQIVRAESELRIDERTRLAVELHDHLAQNLTAIAYQLASAERSQTSAPEASSRHLSTAHRMLGSCRTELRRCLWDLRSDALSEPDIALAIRKSIEPVAGDAVIDVSFPVQRTKLSDSTVHAILGIIRELTANAVNHGKAVHIKVEGEMTGGILRFSVTDDGSGFDPASAPDAADGHFGLDGIRERLRKYNGSMSVESAPGNGCRITIVFASGKPQNEQSS